jgi:hypothetical protein
MLSRLAYFISIVVMCYASFFFYPKWQHKQTDATISWDVSGYYWYLPSLFIYKDLKHQYFKDSILKVYAPTGNDFQQVMPLSSGDYVMKYSSGMAFMYLPFFTAAHFLAKPLGYRADGFSEPYQFAIQLGGFLMSILGVWYLRKLLLLFYSDEVVATAIIILVLGSNYLNYSAIDNGMSHCWLFTVYVFILLNTHFFYQSFKTRYAVRIGLLLGLAALTRPTYSIACLIPLLWGVERISFPALKERLFLITKNFKPFLLAVTCGLCVVSIQFIYWKYASGHWTVHSYGANQHLYFRSPNFMNYTFSYRSGWLTYSPMMCLAFIGIIPFLRHGKNKVAILTFFILSYYIVCSWNIWWYGGRAMIQSYPVLIFPIASLLTAVMNKKTLLFVLSPFVLLFIYFNCWLTFNSHAGSGLFDIESMNARYFWRVVGRWEVPENTAFLKDNPDVYEQQPHNAQLIYQNNFSHDTGTRYRVNPMDGRKYLLLNKGSQNSPIYSFPCFVPTAKWMRVEGTFQCNHKEAQWYNMCQFIVRLIDKSKTGDNRIVKENMVIPSRLLDEGKSKVICLDMKLPNKHFDSVNVLIWSGQGNEEISVSNLKVLQFNQ